VTPGGREAVPDTIGLVKVHLVGCLSAKSVAGHLGIVLPNVEIDELLELREVSLRRLRRGCGMARSLAHSAFPSELGLQGGRFHP